MARLKPCWLLVLALTAGCGAGGHDDEGATSGGAAVTAVPVQFATAVRESLPEEVTLTGRLEPVLGGSAIMTAPAAGTVRSVAVTVGTPVARGQVLLHLDVPELAAAARQAELTARTTRQEADRQRQLLADGITSERQAQESAAAAEAAEAARDAAAALLARTRVTSPIAGVVQQVAVQQGERVDAGGLLVSVLRPDPLILVARVPTGSLAGLRPGQPAQVTAEGDTTAWPGRIEAIAPGVDSLTNSGQVRLRVPNPGHRLRPGAGAVARVRLRVRPNVLVVPETAIAVLGDSHVVFVVGADSVARQHVVQVGRAFGGRVPIEGTVAPGDRVVTVGAAGLVNGNRVVLDSTATPKGAGRP